MKTRETERGRRQGSSSGIAGGALAAWAAVALWALPVRAAEIPWATGSVVASNAAAARAVEAADLDGDGDLDLISASFNDDTIAWYDNDGAQSFTKRPVTTVADGARSVATGDLDGDGDLDLVSASQNDDTIAWYENTGGSPLVFTTRIITEDPDDPFTGSEGLADSATSVAVADIDRDGDLDIVFSASGSDIVGWYENDGTPADDANSSDDWTFRGIHLTSDGASSVFAADVNGDGWIDVISASLNEDTVRWHENDGTPTDIFGWVARTVSAVPNGPRSVHAADMDGDGDLDILSASANDDTVRIYQNSGASPPVFSTHALSPNDDQAYFVRAADLDRDGDRDILGVSFGDHTVRWYENTGFPFFTERTITSSATNATGAVAADVDGDGDLDVATSSQGDDTVAWFENLTIHRNALLPEQLIVSDLQRPNSFSSGDIDGDGDLDFAAASSDDTIAWYENQGGTPATFSSRVVTQDPDGILGPENGPADGASDLVVADVDQDGDLDLVFAAQGSLNGDDGLVGWFENTDGEGTFGSRQVVSDLAVGATAVAVADIDGDGAPDILAASGSLSDPTRKVAWYRFRSSPPGWVERVIVSSDFSLTSSLEAADLDGDGDLDVLLTRGLTNEITWYANDGTPRDGGWSSREVPSDNSSPRGVTAGDLDHDGHLDLVASYGFADQKLVWFENDGTPGDGGWTERAIATQITAADSLVAHDMDNDGDLDLLAGANSFSRWYESDGSPADGGWTQHSHSLGAAKQPFGVADLDGDGDGDVLSVSELPSSPIVWYQNGGGQFALPTTDRAQRVMLGGQTEDVFEIEVLHRGRAGDGDLELATLELLFEAGPGSPLTSEKANALIQALRVYRDDGSGAFEAGADTEVGSATPLSLTAGVETVTFTDGHPDVQIAFGAPRTYFVALEIQPGAAFESPASFLVTHLTESSSSAEDRDHDIPLAPEFASDLTLGPIDTFLHPDTCWAPYDLNLAGATVNTTLTCQAGEVLGAGDDFSVVAGGNLTFRAGQAVELRNGFDVQAGELTIEIDPSPVP